MTRAPCAALPVLGRRRVTAASDVEDRRAMTLDPWVGTLAEPPAHLPGEVFSLRGVHSRRRATCSVNSFGVPLARGAAAASSVLRSRAPSARRQNAHVAQLRTGRTSWPQPFLGTHRPEPSRSKQQIGRPRPSCCGAEALQPSSPRGRWRARPWIAPATAQGSSSRMAIPGCSCARRSSCCGRSQAREALPACPRGPRSS